MRLAHTQVWPEDRNLEEIRPSRMRISEHRQMYHIFEKSFVGLVHTISCFFEVGIAENNERRIATQLHTRLFEGLCALYVQKSANGRRASKAKMSHELVLRELSPYISCPRSRGCDDVQHAGSSSSSLKQLGDSDGTEGSLWCGLAYNRVTCRDCCSHLAGNHSNGGVPWRNSSNNALWLADGKDAVFSFGRRDCFAILTFDGRLEPVQKVGAILQHFISERFCRHP